MHIHCDNTNNDRINAFHFINQLWYHLSGLRALFVVIMFTKLCGLLYIGGELWVQFKLCEVQYKNIYDDCCNFLEEQQNCWSCTTAV